MGGSGPSPFSNIGRNARDLLTKDYSYNHKFSWSTESATGLRVTGTGIQSDEVFIGDISTHYRSGKTTVDVKVDTNFNVSTTVKVRNIVPGAKATFCFRIPDQKSGKLDVRYLHDHFAVNSSIGMNTNPVLELAASIGSRKFCGGAEVGFNSTSATFTKCNVGIGFNQHDFSAAVVLTDKGEAVKASYVQFLDPKNRSHAPDCRTLVKARFGDDGKAAVLCRREWRPKSLLTLSAEYDFKAPVSPSRLGLVLALNP